MNLQPKLTICIPTYNRCDYLPIALESVLGQMEPEIEIVICDNGSVDETPAVVQKYLQKFPQITYFRFSKNVGPDRCFLQSIEVASGEYCWFLGDDDRIEEGSLAKVLQALNFYKDLSGISVRGKVFDQQLQRELSVGLIRPHLLSDKLYESGAEIFQDLFIHFGYLSGQICKRSLWKEALGNIDKIERFFNAYIILYVISKVIFLHPKWLYLHEASVHFRSDNDSFAQELGVYRRLLLDVHGYAACIQDLFRKDAFLRFYTLNEVCKTHLHCRVREIRLKYRVPFFGLKAFWHMFPKYGRTRSFWSKNLPWILTPRPIVLFLRGAYRRFIKPYRKLAV